MSDVSRLGCPGFTKPEYRPTPVEAGVSRSLFFPDEAINTHPRFRYAHGTARDSTACFGGRSEGSPASLSLPM